MKTSLDHLPAAKQEQLRAITALIQAETPADQIILFGSYARGDWVEDLATGYISDYDLLIVVKEEAEIRAVLRAPELWEKAKRIAGRVTVSPIVHALKQLNSEIRAGQYFYLDILHEGIRLYDSRRHQLAVPKALGPKERLDRATINFRYWFGSASNFWVVATYTADRGNLAESAFLYHQTAERYFHAALLVLTGYKPKIHDLAELADTSAPQHPAMEGAMPRAEGTEEERIFILLKKAYIEARYSKSYRVTKEELETFRLLTYDLGLRVRQACLERMGTFCGPEKVSELPKAPDPEDRGQLIPGLQVNKPEAFQAWLRAQREQDSREGELRGRAEGRIEGIAEGRVEGRVEGKAEALLAILEARGLPVTEEVRATIEGCADPAILTRWITRAMSAVTAEEIVGAAPGSS